MSDRPIALISGAGRAEGLAAASARKLAVSGWDVALTWWHPYDESMPWGGSDIEALLSDIRSAGGRAFGVEADLSVPAVPKRLFDTIEEKLGLPSALILSHCRSVDSDLFSTTVEEFDSHYAVNVRAVWLMIREFARRFRFSGSPGRIIALTSDHTAGNLPYGATKGAMDRIVLAAAQELADRNINANVVNPGAVDNGWMTDDIRQAVRDYTLQGTVGRAEDAAGLIAFLCSDEGRRINAQILYCDGGIRR